VLLGSKGSPQLAEKRLLNPRRLAQGMAVKAVEVYLHQMKDFASTTTIPQEGDCDLRVIKLRRFITEFVGTSYDLVDDTLAEIDVSYRGAKS